MTRRTFLSYVQVDKAIQRIVNATHTSKDIETLISHFCSADDISPLCHLLNSKEESTLRDGIYILSELGKSGTPLRETAMRLLDHSDSEIRYWAMNSVVSCFEAGAAKEAIDAAHLLNDPDEFVRARAWEMITALH